MNTFQLEIVTPDRADPVRDVAAIEVPAEGGRLTVLAGHQPLVCLLRPGILRIRPPAGAPEEWRVAGGTLTVAPERVTVLTREASAASRPTSQGG